MVKILMHFYRKAYKEYENEKSRCDYTYVQTGDKLEKLLRRLLEQSVPVVV